MSIQIKCVQLYYELYVVKNMTLLEIEEMFGYSHSTVWYTLNTQLEGEEFIKFRETVTQHRKNRKRRK